jgi:hypothetical protein
MAVCQAQKLLPKYLISSLGSFGCGWHSAMPSSSACYHGAEVSAGEYKLAWLN